MDAWRRLKNRLGSFHTILMILITLGYLLGTHLSTINSLKMALASKAERTELLLLDKKLTRIEVKLEGAIMTKQELNDLRDHFDRALMEAAVRIQATNERTGSDGR